MLMKILLIGQWVNRRNWDDCFLFVFIGIFYYAFSRIYNFSVTKFDNVDVGGG
jgi:hypothetical protein